MGYFTGASCSSQASDVYSLFCFLRYLPFSNILVFNQQIRNKVHGIRGRKGPSQSTRSRGYQELKIAMSVSFLVSRRLALYVKAWHQTILCALPHA